jgi:CheY-like chemotaxis protein
MTHDFPILVAEDNPEDAELLKLALRRVGFHDRIIFVPDGQAAVDYLEGRGEYADRYHYPFPQVLISDLKMPRVNGFELLEWLRKDEQCCVIPAILLSGSGLAQDVKAAYKLGANTYFQKPSSFFDLVELLTRLKEYWTRSELPAAVGKR